MASGGDELLAPDVMTWVKAFVDKGYHVALSGSLLGVELNNVRSVPVGYMDEKQMFPCDFEEFIRALGVQDSVIQSLRVAWDERKPADAYVHQKMMQLVNLYLLVGGMPAVVQTYLETNDMQRVLMEQRSILALYKKDIARYDPEDKLYINDIFDLIPSELNAKNKRFILKNLNEHFKFSRHENSFTWLRDADMALPTHNAEEPKAPLILSKASNLFKLFPLYYFQNKKQGELDFLLERDADIIPLEVKSGKGYDRHVALNNVMKNLEYGIQEAIVLCNDNLSTRDNVTYAPIYMLMFIEKVKDLGPKIYKLDLGGLI